MKTLYVLIGNSDDKLTQPEWADFVEDVQEVVTHHAAVIHGKWFSEPSSPWQNACWCIEVNDHGYEDFTACLTRVREEYRKDSIAVAKVMETRFF